MTANRELLGQRLARLERTESLHGPVEPRVVHVTAADALERHLVWTALSIRPKVKPCPVT